MIKFILNDECKDIDDLILKLEEVMRLLKSGFTSSYSPSFYLESKVMTIPFPEDEQEYDDGQGRKYDILDSELHE